MFTRCRRFSRLFNVPYSITPGSNIFNFSFKLSVVFFRLISHFSTGVHRSHTNLHNCLRSASTSLFTDTNSLFSSCTHPKSSRCPPFFWDWCHLKALEGCQPRQPHPCTRLSRTVPVPLLCNPAQLPNSVSQLRQSKVHDLLAGRRRHVFANPPKLKCSLGLGRS